jgi:hypothetical protein
MRGHHLVENVSKTYFSKTVEKIANPLTFAASKGNLRLESIMKSNFSETVA